MVTFERDCCVLGYQRIWDAVIEENLNYCKYEPSDRYAVAVAKDEIVIGHLPRKFLHLYSLSLRRGGRISCTVTGT